MITSVNYGGFLDRNDILYRLQTMQYPTVVDIGATINPWGGDCITHIVDLHTSSSPKYHQFTGDINEEHVWNDVRKYCADERNGERFDFSICAHTLEDILNPKFAAQNISTIAKGGYVSMPSKWADLTRSYDLSISSRHSKHFPNWQSGNQWKGWMHHRWIFDVIDGVLVCVPKLPYLEYVDTDAYSTKPRELSFYWEDSIPVKILNNDFIGPSETEYMDIVLEFLDK